MNRFGPHRDSIPRRGPNGLKFENKATHGLVRWTRVASMTGRGDRADIRTFRISPLLQQQVDRRDPAPHTSVVQRAVVMIVDLVQIAFPLDETGHDLLAIFSRARPDPLQVAHVAVGLLGQGQALGINTKSTSTERLDRRRERDMQRRPPVRTERPRNRTKDHPAPSLTETSRLDGVRPPQTPFPSK